MKKKLSLIFAVTFLMFSLVACNSTKDASVESGKKIIRISNGQPEDHPDNVGMRAFKEYIEERLGDKYQVMIYPNELLGSSKNALELCQTGALEYVICSSSNMETFSSLYSIFSMPYLFSSQEAYYKTMENPEILKPIYESTISQGVESVGWFDAGTRNFYGHKPIKTVEDVKGMKIRVQPSPTNVAMMKAFNAGAVPMSFSEVYTALQNGTIDAAENNEIALTTVKHGEVAEYYSYNMHQIVPDLLVASTSFLDGLSDEEREIFDEATKIATEVEREEWTKKTDEAIKISKEKMGVEFVESDVMSFKERVLPLHEKMIKDNPEMSPIYEAIDKINKETEKEAK